MDNLQILYEYILSLNTGISFVLWFTYLSIILASMSSFKTLNIPDFETQNLRARIFSSFMVVSLITLYLTTVIFERVFSDKTLYLLKNIILSSSIMLSPLATRLLWIKTTKLEVALTIYGTLFVTALIMVIINSTWNVVFAKLVILIISTVVFVIESTLFITINSRKLNIGDKLKGTLFSLTPSILSLSVMAELSVSILPELLITIQILVLNVAILAITIRNVLEVYREYKHTMDEFTTKVKNEEKLFRWFTGMLISILEARDPYTKGHSERVAKYAYNLSKLVYNNTYIPNFLEIGALLHDIGKVGVRDEVLFATSKLGHEAMEEMKSHVVIGKELLSSVSIFRDVSDIAYLHHERVDGLGYVLGLRDGEIPIPIKITTIVDSFDAMNTARVYRKKLDIDVIINEIKRNLNSHFDAKIGSIFLKNINRVV